MGSFSAKPEKKITVSILVRFPDTKTQLPSSSSSTQATTTTTISTTVPPSAPKPRLVPIGDISVDVTETNTYGEFIDILKANVKTKVRSEYNCDEFIPKNMSIHYINTTSITSAPSGTSTPKITWIPLTTGDEYSIAAAFGVIMSNIDVYQFRLALDAPPGASETSRSSVSTIQTLPTVSLQTVQPSPKSQADHAIQTPAVKSTKPARHHLELVSTCPSGCKDKTFICKFMCTYTEAVKKLWSVEQQRASNFSGYLSRKDLVLLDPSPGKQTLYSVCDSSKIVDSTSFYSFVKEYITAGMSSTNRMMFIDSILILPFDVNVEHEFICDTDIQNLNKSTLCFNIRCMTTSEFKTEFRALKDKHT